MFIADQVISEMKDGLIFVCAMCKRYWEGKEKGMKRWDGSVKCTSKNGCGSPSSGGVFNDYQGPITNLKDVCYVCGKTSSYALRAVLGETGVVTNKRMIGVCKGHLDLVKRLRMNEVSKRVVDGQSKRIYLARKPEIITG